MKAIHRTQSEMSERWVWGKEIYLHIFPASSPVSSRRGRGRWWQSRNRESKLWKTQKHCKGNWVENVKILSTILGKHIDMKMREEAKNGRGNATEGTHRAQFGRGRGLWHSFWKCGVSSKDKRRRGEGLYGEEPAGNCRLNRSAGWRCYRPLDFELLFFSAC